MKKRLDLLLVERGVFSSRNKAKEAIQRGKVKIKGEISKKPGTKLAPDAEIGVENEVQYPGRGGLKLEGALDALQIVPRGWTVLDGGASTGGFTACLLRRGAKKVYAVDVGSGQLDTGLRKDSRVVAVENYNLREFSPDLVGEALNMIVLDLSFISATLVMAPLNEALSEKGLFLILVKPQYELGPKKVQKGIVRDCALWREAIEKVVQKGKNLGLGFSGIIRAPITGVRGNQEFFLLLQKGSKGEFKEKDWRDGWRHFHKGCEN